MVLDGVTGIIARLDVQEIANALEKLARSSELRAKMGAAGKEYTMARYGVDRLVKDHQDLYLRLLNR